MTKGLTSLFQTSNLRDRLHCPYRGFLLTPIRFHCLRVRVKRRSVIYPHRAIRRLFGLTICVNGFRLRNNSFQIYLYHFLFSYRHLMTYRLLCRLLVGGHFRFQDSSFPATEATFVIRPFHTTRVLFTKKVMSARGDVPTVPTLSFSYRPYINNFPNELSFRIIRRLLTTNRPNIKKSSALVKDRCRRLIFWIIFLTNLCVSPLVRVTTIRTHGVNGIVSGSYALAFRGFMRVGIYLRVSEVTWRLHRHKTCRLFTVRRGPLFNGMPNGIPMKDYKLNMRLGRRPSVNHFLQICRRLLYISAIRLSELHVRTMENFPTRLGTPLATKMMDIHCPLLCHFPFGLNRRSASVRRNPSRQHKNVGLFHEKRGLRVMLLRRLRRINGIRGKATSAIRLMGRSLYGRTPLSIPRRFLGLQAIYILTTMPFIYMFLTIATFRLMFTGFGLTFGKGTILFICQLSYVSYICPVIRVITPFLGGRARLLAILLCHRRPHGSVVNLRGLVSQLPRSPTYQHAYKAPRGTTIPIPNI